jgi:hypothetical protein
MDDHVDAVAEVAGDGIDFDGLRVEESGDGYAFQTPATERSGLDEDELRAVAADSPFVTNWYYWHALAPQKDDRWAFLRWVEGATDRGVPERYDALADGVSREWGQLEITATLAGDGERQYELRHVADAGTGPDALDTDTDPLEARSITKYDDDGQYRPLKTAPSLQTGWRFVDLDGADLVAAVGFFYPATITNWHLERGAEGSGAPAERAGAERHGSREGGLDVSHWHETMERQTGIYGLIQTWDRGEGHEHVEWVAEACCDDSQCLKRREWQYDDETELDAPGGDGAFPCREPCSLVIAAARKWTKLESEEPQTYEFELTPSEKEQLEEIVDAVADGRTDEIRDADVYDGANRYRARFLRAKLFDEDGHLPAVERRE